ncbi:hypothetical protein SVIOM74S_01288 [Streptomyces violarus]
MRCLAAPQMAMPRHSRMATAITTSIITLASLPRLPKGPQSGAIPPMMVLMSPLSAAKSM